MFVDLHMHERTFSKDSLLTLKEIVEIAKEKGLDGVCITDHDDIGIKEYAEQYSRETGFPIFVGYEFYSLQGDILAFGAPKVPSERISAQEFVDYVKSFGGVCIAAHPFRNNNRGLEENLATVKGLDGIEALNGSTLPDACSKAFSYAKQLGIQCTGASDCHVPSKVGVYATWLPETVSTLDDFISVFKKGQCRPAVYQNGGYVVVDQAR
ncbi:MAG: PHP domain-containing protein [Clostridium sp.]